MARRRLGYHWFMRRYHFLTAFLFYITCQIAYAGTEVSLSVDKQNVSPGEKVKVEVTVTGEGVALASMPELRGNGDFETVVLRVSQEAALVKLDTSKGLRRENYGEPGDRSMLVETEMTSVKTYTYLLQAMPSFRSAGISASLRTADGEFSSNVVELFLKRRSASKRGTGADSGVKRLEGGKIDFSLKCSISRLRAYVGQEVIFTSVFLSAARLRDGPFFAPVKSRGFWVEKLSDTRREKARIKTNAGREYSVTEITRILYPLSAGEASVGPVSVKFKTDQYTPSVELTSEPMTVRVIPLPEKGRPEGFTGLIGEFSIDAKANRKSVKKEGSILFTVTVSGRGNVHRIPEPSVPELAGFDVYGPEISDDFLRTGKGSEGSRSFAYALVPKRTGHLRIGGFHTSAFDPGKGEYIILETSPIEIKVLEPRR